MPQLPLPITSRTNAKVKALREAFSGSASKPGDLVGIEGLTLVAEAHRSGLALETVYLQSGSERLSAEPAVREAGQTVVLSREIFESAVSTVSPQPIAATLRIPELERPGLLAPSQTFLLLQDIQDPGNLGTLLRSGEAFGVDEFLFTPGCANQWSPKVIRASAGSVFRARVHRLPITAALKLLQDHGVRTAAAVVQTRGAVPSHLARLTQPIALLIGNEGAGLTEQAISLADERVHIPCRTESLNAAIAGALLLYEAQRQNLPAGPA